MIDFQDRKKDRKRAQKGSFWKHFGIKKGSRGRPGAQKSGPGDLFSNLFCMFVYRAVIEQFFDDIWTDFGVILGAFFASKMLMFFDTCLEDSDM